MQYTLLDLVRKRKYHHIMELKTGPDDCGRRLDRVLRKALPDHSLSLIHRLLRQGKVRLDGKPAGPGDLVQPGAVIQVVIQEGTGDRCPQSKHIDNPLCLRTATPQPPPPLPAVLWQGSGIIVFNKPSGLATHGKDSLDTLVKAWLAGKLPSSLSFKPGPLHRLDRATSGAIAFSETIAGAQLFTRLLRERKVVKTYLAVVEGRITADALWQNHLARDASSGKTFAGEKPGAKDALTVVKALASNGSYTLIEAHIVTGRTHQIRAQAALHGHPLAGDAKYGGHIGGKYAGGGFLLHAWKMDMGGYLAGFPQPLIAPLPESFLSRISALFGKDVYDKIHDTICR